ncbi:unnamed protein product [Agarophyton chilense]|eukprot:gb/GEZJ01002867.1/.p2 GENE.gb/GEZJ01002867.1/~~gb/GEZJ01002867.1/.p2  ORF type:complete len:205 (-),score=26.95 gb/GEZJ01002867.1/:1067-1681(-)
MVAAQPPPLERRLFGAAITANVPSHFVDVSTVRQVPDNQEVFSHPQTDRSIIFDILQLNTSIPSPEHRTAASHHFAIIAEDSSATSCSLVSTRVLDAADYPALTAREPNVALSFAYGQHVVAKFRDNDMYANTVDVYVVCIRLPSVTTDILLCFNDPVALHPHSSSTRLGSTVAHPLTVDTSLRSAVLQQVLNTFVIRDYTLFQ